MFLLATAANYYLRSAFFSDLEKSYFLTLALREVSVSETGCTCVQMAANTNTDPSEGVHYFTTIFQLAEQTVTHTWEPLPNHSIWYTTH